MLGAGIAVLIALGTACSPDASEGQFVDGGATYSDATAPATDSGVIDSATPKAADPLPIYWSLSGTLAIGKKGVNTKTTRLEIELWTKDLVEACKAPVALTILEVSDGLPADADLVLNNWFELTLAETPGVLDCPGWPAGILGLGLGLYDGSLDPALEAQGYRDTPLYGLYLQNPTLDASVYLVGVGGTAAMYQGKQELTAAELPLPPDDYRLESLIVLDL